MYCENNSNEVVSVPERLSNENKGGLAYILWHNSFSYVMYLYLLIYTRNNVCTNYITTIWC